MAKKKNAPKKTPRKARPKKANSAPRTNRLEEAGRAIGSSFGGPIGGIVGGLGGSIISRLTGFGEYKLNSNTVLAGATVPTFMNHGDGVEISHREFIADITGTSAFTLTAFALNPGLVTTFPLLANIAANFDQYEMKGLVFEYRPTSGMISGSNTAMGTVIMATGYDPYDPNFHTKVAMESSEYSTAVAPYMNGFHPVECAPDSRLTNTSYVRTGTVPVGASLTNYDLGTFQIATQGCPANVVGELWVTYHVKLKKPRLNPLASGFAHIAGSAAGTCATAAVLGTTGGVIRYSNVQGLYMSPTVPQTTFVLSQAGYYMIVMIVSGSASGFVGFSAIGGNITVGPNVISANTNYRYQLYQSGQAASSEILFVDEPGVESSNRVVLTCPGLTGGNSDIFVYYLGTAVPT